MNHDSVNCFRLLSVSWPRPVQHNSDRWTSTPEWDAPLMSSVPQWQFRSFDAAGYFAIDWRDVFRSDLNWAGQPAAGEMRGFHVIFRLRVELGGKLIFVDADGSIIKRNGELVHEDRESHEPRRHEIDVAPGDRLDIAQWQRSGDWVWGARLAPAKNETTLEALEPYRRPVYEALTNPNGPVLKIYTSAAHPLRCALSIYSMVLNGYRPAGIKVFGDYQWDGPRRLAMAELLPFAEFISIDRVEQTLGELDPRLIPLARRQAFAMKTCVCLFMPPHEYCYLDDDIFILDRIDDALRLHDTHRLVYAPDRDYDALYRKIWCANRTDRLSTGNINTGFYLARNDKDVRSQVARFLQTPPDGHPAWAWEQGFLATEFAGDNTAALPSQRYFYPVFDGLPGGLFGYDWQANPCGFVSVHFGGPKPKPNDRAAGTLVHDILGRCCASA